MLKLMGKKISTTVRSKNLFILIYASTISSSFFCFQHTVIERFWKMIVDGKDGEPLEEPIKIVLTKLCSLYGLWSLEKHLTTLYQGKPIKIDLKKTVFSLLFVDM